MKLEVAKLLEHLGERSELDVHIYEDYSGRFMYGSTTTAIVVDNPLKLISIIGYLLSEGAEGFSEICEYSESLGIDVFSIHHDLMTLNQDNLGKDFIIY